MGNCTDVAVQNLGNVALATQDASNGLSTTLSNIERFGQATVLGLLSCSPEKQMGEGYRDARLSLWSPSAEAGAKVAVRCSKPDGRQHGLQCTGRQLHLAQTAAATAASSQPPAAPVAAAATAASSSQPFTEAGAKVASSQ